LIPDEVWAWETLFWKSKAILPQHNELRKLSCLAFRGGKNEIL